MVMGFSRSLGFRLLLVFVGGGGLSFGGGCLPLEVPCKDDRVCISGLCIGGFCKPRKPCTQDGDCLAGQICDPFLHSCKKTPVCDPPCGAFQRCHISGLDASCVCLPRFDRCGSSCVALASSLLHCGACGVSCGKGQSCIEGRCQCPRGQVVCDGLCVDLQSNPSHCGSCGKACSVEESCQTDGVRGRCLPRPGSSFEVEGLPEGRARYIPAGSYLRGSPLHESQRHENESPHPVVLTRSFFIFETEVSQKQYKAVMKNDPSHTEASCGDLCPVNRVTRDDALAFAAKLSRDTGFEVCSFFDPKAFASCKGWRLPTEAEWEYAARAGSLTPFHTGGCIGSDQANFDGSLPYQGCPPSPYRKTIVGVEALAANAWGLRGVHGNVWEWTLDGAGPYPTDFVTDPFSKGGGSSYVLRGGGYSDSGDWLRSAKRRFAKKDANGTDIGFRLVRFYD